MVNERRIKHQNTKPEGLTLYSSVCKHREKIEIGAALNKFRNITLELA